MTDATGFLRHCLLLADEPDSSIVVQEAAREMARRWPTLEPAIESARIGPLLHRAIGRRGILPARVGGELQKIYRLAGLHHLLRSQELASCLRGLGVAGVPVVVLKGAALAETVYGNPALRPMGDVDLLVERSDLSTAGEVLGTLGFAQMRPETRPGVLAEHENELVFRKRHRIEIHIDVHWSLFDSPYYQERLAMDWFWRTARQASVAGVSARVLGPEALLLHLCGHLCLHHGALGLLWWNDVTATIDFYAEEIDWPQLLQRAVEKDLVLPLREVLIRAASEWGADIPADVLESLRSMVPSPQERRVFAHLTAVDRPAGRRFWADLTAMSGWRRRLRFAATSLFPSAAYMRDRYGVRNPLLLPLYYPYRWWRGLCGKN